MGRFHERYDFYLTPTLAAPPVEVGTLKPSGLEIGSLKLVEKLRLGGALIKGGWVERLAEESLEKMPFTQLANLTGQPGMSVPLYWTPNGLPLGVQFVAGMNNEHQL